MTEGYSTQKTLALIMLIAVLGFSSALLLSWQYSIKGPEPEQQVFKADLILETEKKTYNIGEPVKVKIFLVNNEAVKVELRSINYNLTICHLNQTIYKTGVYEKVLYAIPIDPGSTYQIPTSYNWYQTDFTNRQVLIGVYTIEVKLSNLNLTAMTNVVIEK